MLRGKCSNRASNTIPNAPPVLPASEFVAQVLLLQKKLMTKRMPGGRSEQSRAEQSLPRAENLQKRARWVVMLGKNTDLSVQPIFKGKQLWPVWQALLAISVCTAWPVYDIFLKDISHLKLYQSFRQHVFPIPYNLENSLLASTAGNTAQYLLSAGSHPGQWFQQAESAFWWGCSAPAHQHVPNPALLPFCQTLAVSAGTVLLPDLYLQVTPSSLPEGELLFFNNNKHHLLNTEYSYQCWLALAAQE